MNLEETKAFTDWVATLFIIGFIIGIIGYLLFVIIPIIIAHII